jgi:digeranylgeranylglycerophospholipid reductase
MKRKYDVVVVGGGPGGSWAAKHAADRGLSVLMLEKDREIGVPVRCAEGLSATHLEKMVKIEESWIAATIRGARLVAPDQTIVSCFAEEVGYVLHRKLFDAGLASHAARSGAEVITDAYVNGLRFEDGVVTGVTAEMGGSSVRIDCRIVIGADGIESRVGRWAGIETRIPFAETESCLQMTLTGIDVDPEIVEFHFGNELAPGGYLWVFPKGAGWANVGLGISGRYARRVKPMDKLKAFIDRRYPDASVLSLVAGCVPANPHLDSIIADGLMLVGDAAHQTNPLSGGGIINAMIAGEIAGAVAHEAIARNDVSQKGLKDYPRRWRKAEGLNLDRSYKIKNVVERFKDEEFNQIAHLLLDIPESERTVLRIFKTALLRHPRLILEAAKVFV